MEKAYVVDEEIILYYFFTRGFPAPNPVMCMSREAFTIKLDIENPQIRLESLELPSLSLLNYQPLSQTISVT